MEKIKNIFIVFDVNKIFMIKTLYALVFVVIGFTACTETDPFNGQGARPSLSGVTEADVVKIEKALYDEIYKELYIYWEPVSDELKASFLGTEVTFTTHTGQTLTTEIMRDKNFPQAYERMAIATKAYGSVIYRSIWRNDRGERIFSDYCKLKDIENLKVETVRLGEEMTFKNMHMPEWAEYNPVKGTPASDMYYSIVGNPPYEFCEKNLKIICGAMWFSDKDPYAKLKKLECQFKPSDILAYVTWAGETTIMCVSQNYVQEHLNKPVEDTRFEITGVCLHELTHTMQVSCSRGTEFDGGCYVEGGADASRLICGGFTEEERLARSINAVSKPEDQTLDPKSPPHPWLNQYSDSGFFMAWLRRYDGDFWRKLNCSTQILNNNDWTFEAATKLIFADNERVQKDIATVDCKDDLMRGLWRLYKKDVESEQIPE